MSCLIYKALLIINEIILPVRMIGQIRLQFCLLILSIFIITGLASAKDTIPGSEKNIEIEYGYPDQSIFVATINDKGQPDTPMTRLAEVLMDKAGLPWHSMPYPARRLFENLKSGTTNFSILVRASMIQDYCIFSKNPVYSTSLNIYYIGDKAPVKIREDLIGKRIITIRGYSYAGLLKFISDPVNQISNEAAGTHKAAFAMLKEKRADYVVDYESAASEILAVSPIKGLHSNAISTLDIFLVLSKAYPDAEELMRRLEEIVQTLNVDDILKGKSVKKM